MILIFSSADGLQGLQLPSGVTIGKPIIGPNGQAAISHPFGEQDLTVLISMGGRIVDELPAEWEMPT